MEEAEIRRIVRNSYADIAKKVGSCCSRGCSTKIGYTKDELNSVPEGADLSLGCGNPVALASLKEGEIVLDLGSGPRLDCFLAANKVGEKGRVIGVDMTPEMIERAREYARKGNYANVEFRLGEIENLPVADGTVDVAISNCVINLSLNKRRVFEEAFRVLKPNGRLLVSDIVLLKGLPQIIKTNMKAYVGCLSGAVMKDEYLTALKDAGFQKVEVIGETRFSAEGIIDDDAAKDIVEDLDLSVEYLKEIAKSVISIRIHAAKPPK